MLFNQDGSIERGSIAFFSERVNSYENKNLYLNCRITLKSACTSASKVRIILEETGAVLCTKDKKVYMIQAFRKYFIKAMDSTDIANSIGRSSKISSHNAPSEKNLYRAFNLNGRFLEKESYDLLQTSTILAVWTLIPIKRKVVDKEGKERIEIIDSEMIGLARDEDGKLFHWTTNLGQDISVLMNYKSAS